MNGVHQLSPNPDWLCEILQVGCSDRWLQCRGDRGCVLIQISGPGEAASAEGGCITEVIGDVC